MIAISTTYFSLLYGEKIETGIEMMNKEQTDDTKSLTLLAEYPHLKAQDGWLTARNLQWSSYCRLTNL